MNRLGRILVYGIAISGVYYLGKYNGFEEGEVKGKEDIVMSLALDRHDAQYDARFSMSSQEQDEIIEYSGSITNVFDLLRRRGHFEDLSHVVRNAAFPE